MSTTSRIVRRATAAGAVMSVAAACMSIANALTMPTLTRPRRSVAHAVVVCVPARNEVTTLPALIGDLRAQSGCPNLRVIVLDDGSSDGTYEAAVTAVADDPRFHVIRSDVEPPPGWTGKAAACHRLAQSALAEPADHIAFVDADVRLDPAAVAAASETLGTRDAALVSPWPRQITGSAAEALVQPLLGFSWMSTLPVRVANASTRPSTVVSCGQFMMFDRSAYQAIGGHSSVAASRTEDLDIARVLRRSGRRTVLVSGGGLVSCRMYDGWPALREGYARWLWNAFGSVAGTSVVVSAMSIAYLVPPAAAVLGSGPTRRWGLLGYGAAVLSRTVAARAESKSGSLLHTVAASTAHPVSTTLYIALTAESMRRRRDGTATWKNRLLPAA